LSYVGLYIISLEFLCYRSCTASTTLQVHYVLHISASITAYGHVSRSCLSRSAPTPLTQTLFCRASTSFFQHNASLREYVTFPPRSLPCHPIWAGASLPTFMNRWTVQPNRYVLFTFVASQMAPSTVTFTPSNSAAPVVSQSASMCAWLDQLAQYLGIEGFDNKKLEPMFDELTKHKLAGGYMSGLDFNGVEA
jgi:hypothetical protein